MRRWATERWKSTVYGTFCKGIRSDRTCRVSRFFWLRFCRGTADIPEYSSYFRRTARREKPFFGNYFYMRRVEVWYLRGRLSWKAYCDWRSLPNISSWHRGFSRFLLCAEVRARRCPKYPCRLRYICLSQSSIQNRLRLLCRLFCSNRIVNFRRIRKRKPTMTPARLRCSGERHILLLSFPRAAKLWKRT